MQGNCLVFIGIGLPETEIRKDLEIPNVWAAGARKRNPTKDRFGKIWIQEPTVSLATERYHWKRFLLVGEEEWSDLSGSSRLHRTWDTWCLYDLDIQYTAGQDLFNQGLESA